MQETGVRRLRKMSARNSEKSSAPSSAGTRSFANSGRPDAKSRTAPRDGQATRKRRNLAAIAEGVHIPMVGVKRSGFCVYELRDHSGAVVYVGMTNKPPRRLLDHIASGRFPISGTLVETSWHSNTRLAQIMERAKIRYLNPSLNRMDYHSPIWSGPFIEREWPSPRSST